MQKCAMPLDRVVLVVKRDKLPFLGSQWKICKNYCRDSHRISQWPAHPAWHPAWDPTMKIVRGKCVYFDPQEFMYNGPWILMQLVVFGYCLKTERHFCPVFERNVDRVFPYVLIWPFTGLSRSTRLMGTVHELVLSPTDGMEVRRKNPLASTRLHSVNSCICQMQSGIREVT